MKFAFKKKKKKLNLKVEYITVFTLEEKNVNLIVWIIYI